MIAWLEEQEKYQKKLFTEWTEHSIEAMKVIKNDYPFLNLEIICDFKKDDWLSGNSTVYFNLDFKLKPSDKNSFLKFFQLSVDSSTFNYISNVCDELLCIDKKINLDTLIKTTYKLNKIKYDNSNKFHLNQRISCFEKYSPDEDFNDLVGLRNLLAPTGLLTNNWFTILDKSRSYDIKFNLSHKELVIENDTPREKFYNDSVYGFNNIPLKNKKQIKIIY